MEVDLQIYADAVAATPIATFPLIAGISTVGNTGFVIPVRRIGAAIDEILGVCDFIIYNNDAINDLVVTTSSLIHERGR